MFIVPIPGGMFRGILKTIKWAAVLSGGTAGAAYIWTQDVHTISTPQGSYLDSHMNYQGADAGEADVYEVILPSPLPAWASSPSTLASAWALTPALFPERVLVNPLLAPSPSSPRFPPPPPHSPFHAAAICDLKDMVSATALSFAEWGRWVARVGVWAVPEWKPSNRREHLEGLRGRVGEELFIFSIVQARRGEILLKVRGRGLEVKGMATWVAVSGDRVRFGSAEGKVLEGVWGGRDGVVGRVAGWVHMLYSKVIVKSLAHTLRKRVESDQ